jgi:hypothetical protein
MAAGSFNRGLFATAAALSSFDALLLWPILGLLRLLMSLKSNEILMATPSLQSSGLDQLG